MTNIRNHKTKNKKNLLVPCEHKDKYKSGQHQNKSYGYRPVKKINKSAMIFHINFTRHPEITSDKNKTEQISSYKRPEPGRSHKQKYDGNDTQNGRPINKEL